MCRFPISAATLTVCLIALAGCAGVPAEQSSETVTTVGEAPRAGETTTETTRPSAEQPAAEVARNERTPETNPAPTRERTVRETMSDRLRPAATSASESRAETPSTAKLVAQLNDVSRELAALRASNARLRGERAAESTTVRVDPAEEKLAASLQSYAQFKKELTGFLAEMEKARTENSALGAQLQEATSQLQQAKSAVDRIEHELQTERLAHARTEQSAAKLREQLRTIAEALASAGLKLDSLAPATEPSARLEINESRLRAASGSGAAAKHTVKAGDTLESIAERYYGDASKWRTITDANRGRLRLDGMLDPGTELEIPRR